MKDYVPIDEWPDFNGAVSNNGPLKFTERGEPVKEQDLYDNDYVIVSTSNTSPIKVTVTAPAGCKYSTGEYVKILGSGDANAEGLHQITMVDATSFTLNGTTADGGAGAGGRVYHPKKGVLSKLIDAAKLIGAKLGFTPSTQAGDPLAIPVSTAINNTLHVTGAQTLDSTTTVTSTTGVRLTGAAPTKTADPGANNIAIGANQVKAWAHITIGNNVFTHDDGINVASIAVNSGDHSLLDVAFQRAMANTTYGVTFGWELSSGIPIMVNGSQTTAGFQIAIVKTSNFAQKFDLVSDSQVTPLSFTVQARQ